MKKIIFLFILLFSVSSAAQRDFSQVKIRSEKLSENVYVLFGAGGNIGLAVGANEAYLIDAQFGQVTDKILEHVKTITANPIKWLSNTHWHGDHTGGNENLAKQGVIIIGSENLRESMASKKDRGEGRFVKPSPEAALPIITFNNQLTLHLDNGSSMHAIYVNPAHTDGDSFYYFPEENVLHVGDNFSPGRYPYIDLRSGGDIDGLISNLTMALGMVDEETKIIPGHGKIAKKAELESYRNRLVTLRERVVKARGEGQSLEAIQKLPLTNDLDELYGESFPNAKDIIGYMFHSAD